MIGPAGAPGQVNPLTAVPTSELGITIAGPALAGVGVLDLDSCSAAGDAGTLRLTDHAVQRYRERIEPLPRPAARRALARLAEQATITGRPPGWLAGALTDRVGFGVIAGRLGVCLIVVDGAVVTVLREGVERSRPEVHSYAGGRSGQAPRPLAA